MYNEIEPYWFSDPERHADAMREVIEPVMYAGQNGQHYSGLHLNRDFSSRPPIVRLVAWMCGSNSPEQKYAAYQYAAANPERGLVMLDMPSHGYSDDLTPAQRREINETGELTQIAAAQAQAVHSRLPDAKQLVVVGDSLGARMAPDFVQKAGEVGLSTELMIGFEMVGLESRPSIAVAKAFFINESLRSRQLYRRGEYNQSLDVAYEQDFKAELQKFGFRNDFSMINTYKSDPRLTSFIFRKSPLASNTGYAALEKALESNRDLTAQLVVGGMSTICRWRKIAASMGALQAEYGSRLSVDVWPHDAHGMGLAPQQPRMAAYTSQQLDMLSCR